MSRETQPAVPTGHPLSGIRRPLRTSLLSPAELAATLEAGAEPCGVVQGTAAMWSPSDDERLLSPDLVAAAG